MAVLESKVSLQNLSTFNQVLNGCNSKKQNIQATPNKSDFPQICEQHQHYPLFILKSNHMNTTLCRIP